MYRLLPRVCFVLALATLTSSPLHAIGKFSESFDSRQYMDSVTTTAHWDTVAGELTLGGYSATLVGNYDTPGLAVGVAIDGDYAFVADHSTNFRIIDISDPANPGEIGYANVGDYAFDVAVDGDYAYVCAWAAGLKIFDVSNPASPALVGTYINPGQARNVVVDGDRAYLADYFSFTILNVSDPTNPTPMYSYATPSTCWDVAVSGHYAYVIARTTGLLVFDLDYPQSLVGGVPLPAAATGVVVEGDHAYVSHSDGLQVVDITDPTSPTLEGTFGSPYVFCENLCVEGDIAYLAFRVGGLQVVDVSDPANPALLTSYVTAGEPYNVAVDGEHVFVADYSAGLEVVAVARSVQPAVHTGSVQVGIGSLGVVTAGHYAYVGFSDGLGVVDIADPDNPVYLGYEPAASAMGVDVAGDYAYVGAYPDFHVMDISDPTDPVVVGTLALPARGWDVSVVGDHAFVAAYNAGLYSVDIEDPTAPTVDGICTFGGRALAVECAGDYAYVGSDFTGGLRVIDISDPTTPTLVATLGTTTCSDVAVAGDYVYVANFGAGVFVADISDPTAPVVAGTYDTPGTASGIAVAGNYAFVAEKSFGITALDITNPTNPTMAYNLPFGWAEDVVLSGHHAYTVGSWNLDVTRVFGRRLDPMKNIGQSKIVHTFTGPYAGWVRFNTTQSDSIAWEFSRNGGTSWQVATPGEWVKSSSSITELVWRATLVATPSSDNPACQSVEIEWLYYLPAVAAIVDVPNDQGRQVRLSWDRSGYDGPGSPAPVTEYSIYRRVQPAMAASRRAPDAGGDPERAPPGDWDYLTTVPALGLDNYAIFVPTLWDSTASGGAYQSAFFVRAFYTGGSQQYLDSAPDSGYSVDNLSPHVPEGFMVAYNAEGNALSWEPSPDADFDHFDVFRGDTPDFEPGSENRISSTTSTSWVDDTGAAGHFYRLAAVDRAGNQSDAATATVTSGIVGPVIPRTFALHQNIPNPFNPSTLIRYDVPAGGGEVTLEIFDVRGRLVKTLLDRFVGEGRRSIRWYGTDQRGGRVASGVYFMRLTAPGYDKTIKLTIVQ